MNELTNNILKVYKLATEAEKAEGMNWYKDARAICKRLAEKYNQPIGKVVYVMSALSPNNKWQRNILDTENVLMANQREPNKIWTKENVKGLTATYGLNTLKAFTILQTGDFGVLKGLKTNAFAKNILTLGFDENVTVDFHAYSIAKGVRHTVNTVKRISPKVYEEVSEAYREAGKIAGILPKQMQAITWLAWRNLDKIK